MNLNELATAHYDWVERMGWHNKTPLESLALIASEVGEAAAEYLSDTDGQAFVGELADIVLRIIDFGPLYGWDLDALMAQAGGGEADQPIYKQLLQLTVTQAAAVNAARKATLGADFQLLLGKMLGQVFSLADTVNADLHHAVVAKMALNEQRGTRGRRI